MNKERDSKRPTRVRWNDPSSDLVFGGHPSLQLRATLPFMPNDMRLTAREVALIISPHSPQVPTVYQLLKKGALTSIKLLDAGGLFTGTASELLSRLNQQADDQARTPDWPKTPRRLSGQVRRAAPGLRRVGIEVTFARRREIAIEKRGD